ncbi:MAG: LytTR family DNA-binding domain-containing protein [Desulfovibrionales bacterium]|nr:LytTR family DNA-binding domain-containing protein [Desulfovibrionales bacterium]
MLRTLLVHPDPTIRTQLREKLASVPFLRIVGEAMGTAEALELLSALPYGVVMLGISPSDAETEFDLIRQLRGHAHQPAFVCIATTEHDAFTAFELEATDYILFPCSDERFSRMVARLEQFRKQFNLAEDPTTQWHEPAHPITQHTEAAPETTLQLPLAEEEQEQLLSALRQAWELSEKFRPAELEKLAITSGGRTMLLPYHDIIFIEANEDYTYVHTATSQHLTSYRLKILEARLRPHNFFRVHRKFLVNLDMVTELAALPGSNFMLRTAGRTRIEIPISRRRIGELKQVLGL